MLNKHKLLCMQHGWILISVPVAVNLTVILIYLMIIITMINNQNTMIDFAISNIFKLLSYMTI